MQRIFGIRELSGPATETYLKNTSREYCDLTRKAAETERLIQSISGSTRLLMTTGPELIVVNSNTTHLEPPVRDWQQIQNDAWDIWHARLIS